MRPIKADELRRTVTQAKLDALSTANQALEGMNPKKRAEFIKNNDTLWTSLRYDLWKLGNLKCWYSEVILEADAGEIEHFRPKKKVWKSDPPHDGYWWRAFDLKNFRLAHPLVNKRRMDYSTEQVAGKGCYFPLREEAARATSADKEAAEEPALLDPIDAEDCYLICFDTSSGKPIPRYDAAYDQEGWLHSRACQTINFYHLDEGTWNAQRADLMHEVAIVCDKALQAKAAKDEPSYRKLVKDITQLIDEHAEFSRAAIQVVCEKGMMNSLYSRPSHS